MSCMHLDRYVMDSNNFSYEFIQSFFVAGNVQRSLEIKSDLRCDVCYTKKNCGLHVCMHCGSFSCFCRQHIQHHSEDKKHYLFANITFGDVFCHPCGDYVYHQECEQVSKKNSKITRKSEDSDILRASDARKITPKRTSGELSSVCDKSLIGIRGLTNLEQTCFLNCIIQVFMHTDKLRNYFLGDSHQCSSLQGNNSNCIGCEMFKIFKEFYSGKSEPYKPVGLVQLLIDSNEVKLDGKQQDAQEFLTKFKCLLHKDCFEGDTLAESGVDCKCIIHQIFQGLCQSVIVCMNCKNNCIPTQETFLDVSLSLYGDMIDSEKIMTLRDCTKRHTRAEIIRDKRCTKCHGRITKRLSFIKLPIVLNFHLKRTKSEYKKITVYVSFPEVLDMSEFIKKKQPKGISESHLSTNKYSLYAVVAHKGKDGGGGHFVTYVRQRKGVWFVTSDDKVETVQLEDVLKCQAYLLFYVRQDFDSGDVLHKPISDFGIKIDMSRNENLICPSCKTPPGF